MRRFVGMILGVLGFEYQLIHRTDLSPVFSERASLCHNSLKQNATNKYTDLHLLNYYLLFK